MIKSNIPALDGKSATFVQAEIALVMGAVVSKKFAITLRVDDLL